MKWEHRAMSRAWDYMAVALWTLIVLRFGTELIARPTAGAVLGLGFAAITLILFVIRRSPARTGTAWEASLALIATFLPAVAMEIRGPDGLSVAPLVSSLALAGMAATALNLGRSFGLAPADRGLKDSGFYRVVRHPLYAFELCYFAGFALAVPSWRNWLIVGGLAVLQAARALREERVLAGYEAYRQQVRWRLVPGLW